MSLLLPVFLISVLMLITVTNWGSMLEVEYLKDEDPRLYFDASQIKAMSNYQDAVKRFGMNSLISVVTALVTSYMSEYMKLYLAIYLANAVVTLTKLSLMKLWSSDTRKLNPIGEFIGNLVALSWDALLLIVFTFGLSLIASESVFISVASAHFLVQITYGLLSLLTLWGYRGKIDRLKAKVTIEEAYKKSIKDFVIKTQEKIKREEKK